jgi:hypothetical protein
VLLFALLMHAVCDGGVSALMVAKSTATQMLLGAYRVWVILLNGFFEFGDTHARRHLART